MIAVQDGKIHPCRDGATAKIVDPVEKDFDRTFYLLVEILADQRVIEARLLKQNGAVNPIGAEDDEVGAHRVFLARV